MCTVTYIPQPGGRFILTSNRDENPERSPEDLSVETHFGKTLIFPKDRRAGGSWIACSDDSRAACVLNGAFSKHNHQPPYRISRGVILVNFFGFPSVNEFSRQFDFEGIEPFTLIVIESSIPYEIRWDGKELHFKKLNQYEKYIWSSATLYSPEAQAKRQQWFQQWTESATHFNLESIRNFHLKGGEPDPWNGFVMNRNNVVRTVSITSIVQQHDCFEMIYSDLLRERESFTRLKLKEFTLRN